VQGSSLHRNIAKEKMLAKKYRDAWRHGGGPIWMTPALDPSRSTLYLAVGNPSFSPYDEQPGDNLYTDSIVALDARTGKMKWYYQEVPHDVWDYDAASPVILMQAMDKAHRAVAVAGEAGKTGWFYVLNRDDGKLIRTSPAFVTQQNPFGARSRSGVALQPSGYGGAIAPTAYNPALHLVFVQAREGKYFGTLSSQNWQAVGETHPTLTAIDVDSGDIRWRRRFAASSGGARAEGPLSASDLLFMGEESGGLFDGFEAQTGKLLWSYQTSAGNEFEADIPRRTALQYIRDVLADIKHWFLHDVPPAVSASHVHASPIAYLVDGREYIAIAADAYYRQGRSPGDTIYVFALPR
jgi:glucose dehydrogenase